MKQILAATLCLLLLSGCEEVKPGASNETSQGGLAYTRLFIPGTKDVAIQVAWPTDWAFRENVNQAVPYIGADLILAAGAEGYPAGEVVETFADLKAEGRLWVTPDSLQGQLVVPKENLAKAVEIANAHLVKPTLDQTWFEQVRQGLADRLAETLARPLTRGYDALRWSIFGDQPLRRALSVDPPAQVTSATRDDVLEWHRQTITRTGIKIVIAGEIDAKLAGTTIDALVNGITEGRVVLPVKPSFEVKPRRLLLHAPDATTSTLVFIGPMPPTRDGGELEDLILAAALGGNDQSVLFGAVRTGLRASYGFGAALDAFNRETRVLILSGEIETSKLAEAEKIIRNTYADFRKSPALNDLEIRKGPFREHFKSVTKDPVTTSYSAISAILDGQDPSVALNLVSLVDKVTSKTIATRISQAFPPSEALTMLAVSPDATALPGACVVRSAAEVASINWEECSAH